MPKPAATLLLAATLVLLSTACSPDDGYKRPKVWPKPTEPPPASPIYHDVEEKVPGEEDIARELAEHDAQLAAAVESVLDHGDLLQRESVFVHVLPELLQVDPQRLVDLYARLEPGKGREVLRTELAQLWASKDPPAALRWMKSLEEKERRAAAITAVKTLAPWDPKTATAFAGELEIAGDDVIRKLLKSVGPEAIGREAATN